MHKVYRRKYKSLNYAHLPAFWLRRFSIRKYNVVISFSLFHFYEESSPKGGGEGSPRLQIYKMRPKFPNQKRFYCKKIKFLFGHVNK
jgi:hypothetical protein